MKLLLAFFRLIRWKNLLFIILTQFLFYYCIILSSLPASYYQLSNPFTFSIFLLLVVSSVFIAAAGYIINDYFDINIDRINKPDKMVVEKIISRRWAILWHWILTTFGLAISLYISFKTSWIIFIANVLCTLLLWFYSTTFKKKLLSGNIIISLLTAWTVLVLYFATNIIFYSVRGLLPDISLALNRIFKFAVLYGGFAFIISLIREVVKDIEDMEGDAKYNCKTMPIIWGVPTSKVFAGVWLVVLIGAISVVQFYAFQLGWIYISFYSLLIVILPLIWVLRKLYVAQNNKQYHQLSQIIKLVMLSGILSLLFFKIYIR